MEASLEAQQAVNASVVERQVFDATGCSVCGTHTSSSFRSVPSSGSRLCNSCHCKSYRLKRKAAGLTNEGALARLRAKQAKQAAAGRGKGSAPGAASKPSTTLAAYAAQQAGASPAGEPRWWQPDSPPTPQLAQQLPACRPNPAAQPPARPVAGHVHGSGGEGPSLARLQRRALEEVAGCPAQAALVLRCASRAQGATPQPLQRVVLGLLPRVQLQLPDDPPTMLHTVACLLEAVAPLPDAAGCSAGSRPAGAGAAAVVPPPPRVAVRLTVFAAAGALVGWHEAPAELLPSLLFNSHTKAPAWSAGPAGFSLHFGSAHCPQLELFTALHAHVATAGDAVLWQPPLLPLEPPPAPPAGAAVPLQLPLPRRAAGSPRLGSPAATVEAAWALHAGACPDAFAGLLPLAGPLSSLPLSSGVSEMSSLDLCGLPAEPTLESPSTALALPLFCAPHEQQQAPFLTWPTDWPVAP